MTYGFLLKTESHAARRGSVCGYEYRPRSTLPRHDKDMQEWAITHTAFFSCIMHENCRLCCSDLAPSILGIF